MNSVSFFPVRHYSVAASLALEKYTNELRPSAILIEGPYDFNPKVDELFLPHTLPIAIYSFVRDEEGFSRGAYYPFCDYSPEWIALKTARSLQIPARFIDLPWADICSIEDFSKKQTSETILLYDNEPFWNNAFVRNLCKKMGVSNFDDLWDELFETNHLTQINEYRERASLFCNYVRKEDADSKQTILQREAFMAHQIRLAQTEFQGSILVVTGGYHSSALEERISKPPSMDELSWANRKESSYDRGIALTPYSNSRLGAESGYRSGMPSPGFYDFVWENFRKNESFDHRPFVHKIMKMLHQKGERSSSADRIASETMSRALADLRGHKNIWRRDLIDGLRATLVKDEIARDAGHPLLDSISEVMRGDCIGCLAEGTSLPPIVSDIETTLKKMNLLAKREKKILELRLMNSEQREQTKVLHCLRLLGIAGYSLLENTDMISRKDLGDVKEKWNIIQDKEFHSSCIEAARYGGTLSEAATGFLNWRIRFETDPEIAASCLIDAALAGIGRCSTFLLKQLSEIIPNAFDFIRVCGALNHIVYLYAYDEVLKLENRESLKGVLRETYQRCLNLLDRLGVTSSQGLEQAQGIRTIVQTYQYCSESLELSLEEIRDVLFRVGDDSEIDPFVRGAVCGAQWKLNLALADAILIQLNSFYDSSILGDFLSGLFLIARETVQRDKILLTALNNKISELSYIEFLEALPALRMAFTFFTPREKHQIGRNLSEIINPPVDELTDQEDLKTVLRAIEFERILFENASKYGTRIT
ncbi:hypothetical protein LEP1GSC125_1972 [Leptospira mayottensis 200901122]|uniref:4-aminobutyrate aminotransferase n=1 Tax=Leptospira mayottensis 200901122 TaxID=1193010 RepID=A0AA87SUT4_9LEPT|nr:DUF5682 family protein [Leptospira mayottensis]EKR98395.1 hypothetical protein LEP1GSC125_1972 [Leptospira mayottensis 200901122]